MTEGSAARDDGHIVYLEVRGAKPRQRMPCLAAHLHGSCFRLLGSSPDPEHLPWAFREGDAVSCEEHVFSDDDERGWVVVDHCSHRGA